MPTTSPRSFHLLLQPSLSLFVENMSQTQIRSDQSLSRVRLFATPWIAARQASLSITNSRSSLKLMSIESVMPSNLLILCRPLLLLPPIPPKLQVAKLYNILQDVRLKQWKNERTGLCLPLTNRSESINKMERKRGRPWGWGMIAVCGQGALCLYLDCAHP